MRSCLFFPLLQQELLAEGEDNPTDQQKTLGERLFITRVESGNRGDDGEYAEHALHVSIGDTLKRTDDDCFDKAEDNTKGNDNRVGAPMGTAGLSFALASSALNDDGFHFIPLK